MGIYLPYLEGQSATREMIGEFGGYNHNLRIGSNEFFDMKNLSSDHYPVMSPRKRRGRVRQLSNPNGLFALNGLCWVDGTELYYNGTKVDGLVLEDSPKQFVAMGAQIIIWPDKVLYNTETGEYSVLANNVTTTETVTAVMTRLDGTPYEDYTIAETAPTSPTDGQLWLDTSSTPHVLKQFSTSLGTWASVPTVYVKISSAGINDGFAEYDGVTISGMSNDALNGVFTLYGVGDGYIIVTATIDEALEQTEPVTVERKIPDMDYICESENRIWGCSSEKHEIYASAQGDPKNFNKFLGIASDSYAMTVGSSGDFTGCIAHLGYVLFFKEDMIHKIYGNKPSKYQLTNTHCRGVEKGSDKSLVIVNETLYYNARHDVCAYNASMPAAISEALGKVEYKNAVAGALSTKYYISLEQKDGTGVLMVFDEQRGVWHKEDNVRATHFATLGSDLYYINANDGCIWSVNGTLTESADAGAALEPVVEWYGESGQLGLDSPDNKYISKIQLRLMLDGKALCRVEVLYDDEDTWKEVFRLSLPHKKTFVVPIIPRRCDTMRIRISGYGDVKVLALTKTIEQGSEV